MRKIPLPVIVISIMVIAFCFIILPASELQANDDKRPPTKVEVMQVQKDILHDKVEILGSTYGNESVEITSNITETIKEIKFEDGQKVSQGDVIVILDQEEEQAQLEAIKIQLAEHERELKRIKPLVAKKMSPPRELDERKTLYEITKQRIIEMESQIDDRTLKAPFDGILGIRKVSNGALVEPGTVITTIEDVSFIKLDFSIPSIYLSQLRAGIPIEAVSDAFPDMKFKGMVKTINNRVDPVTRSILVRAVIENTNELIKPGLMMKVSLLQNERDAIIVPEEAVTQQGDERFLMIVKDDNTIEKRSVKTGINREGVIEIANNVNEGETIVVRGVHKVRPGAKVEVSKTWDAIRKPEPGELKE